MINVGVIGLGMMGQTHLDAYAKRADVTVVAISDKDPDRLSGKTRAVGNVEGQAQGGFDLAKAKGYAEGMDLIKDKAVDVVDICLATPLHVEYAIAALKKGKHVLVEKPLARTYKDAMKLVKAAQKAKGLEMAEGGGGEATVRAGAVGEFPKTGDDAAGGVLRERRTVRRGDPRPAPA